ncbi:MAG: Hsp20/alpha crystallin family protein [Planctomycetota bacterium]|nr:MAG: Hsp20/alpha crystallin family protein [Planctomycetota bacterium]
MQSSLIRRDPNSSLHGLDRLFASVLAEPFFSSGSVAATDEGTLALDISEDESHVIVRASLPGFTKDQVHVEVHDGVLSIKAEKEEETEERTERFYRRERRVGSVSRRVALPSVVHEGEAKAELKHGELVLRLPKEPKATPRKISID